MLRFGWTALAHVGIAGRGERHSVLLASAWVENARSSPNCRFVQKMGAITYLYKNASIFVQARADEAEMRELDSIVLKLFL